MRWLSVSLLALALPACAVQGPPDTSTDHQEIVGGTVDTDDPAVVLIEDSGFICTGTVISPHVVLTAGHCCVDEQTGAPLSPGGYAIRFVNAENASGPSLGVTDVHPHGTADMCLLALAQASPADPIPVDTEALDNHLNEPTRIVGFGVTSENGSDSGIKRQGSATLQSVTLEQGGLIYTTNNPQGTCYGDSGGPNFMTINGTEVVVGETTTGTAACGSGLDIGVRVDTFQPWIQAYVAAHDPPTCEADGQCATGCENPDPDCPCATDGLCTNACPDNTLDTDCEGCFADADGTCRQDCPTPDPDCATDPGVDGDGSGCCSTSKDSPAGPIVLALMLAGLVVRRRT